MIKQKYMAQTIGLFGINIGFGSSISEALKKAKVTKYHKINEFGLFVSRNNQIIQINRNGSIKK